MNTLTTIWLHFRCRSFGGICKIGEFADTSTTFWKVRLQPFKWFSKREHIESVLAIFSYSVIVCWILTRWIVFGSFPNFNSRRSRARARRSRARDWDAQTCMHMHTHAQTSTQIYTHSHSYSSGRRRAQDSILWYWHAFEYSSSVFVFFKLNALPVHC